MHENVSFETGSEAGRTGASASGNGRGAATRVDGAASTTAKHGASSLPLLPPAGGHDEALARAVACFHRGDLEGAAALERPADDWLPALLHALRDPSAVRGDYPLFLFAADAGADARLVAPLGDVLAETSKAAALADDDARLVGDNLARLERRVAERFVTETGAVVAADVVAAAAHDVVEALGLAAPSRAQLASGFERLAAALPRGGMLLALVEQAPLLLFTHAARRRALVRRAELGREIGRLRHRLVDLLRVDRTREGRAADEVRDAGAGHVDPAALAKMLGSRRGAHRMDDERRARIEALLETFDRYLGAEPSLMTVITSGEVPRAGQAPGVEWRIVAADAVCATALEVFDAQAREYAWLFSSIRVARLELAGTYDRDRHDRLVRGFGRESFTDDEVASLPPVVALESAGHVAAAGMVALSRVLMSGRPLEVMVTVQPALAPGDGRFELGYLGLSHRRPLVHQSSAARPVHLVDGFLRSMSSTRPSLHVIASGVETDGYAASIGAWLYGGAALEARAHPFFHFDPEAGASWAKRFDFSANPQPDVDWPSAAFACRDATGAPASLELPFTFADFALLERGWREQFRAIPDDAPVADLVPVADFLALDAEEASVRVPFVWCVDAGGRCHRLVVGSALVEACRDRLDYWHTLQELAGTSSEYVREAVAAERSRLEAELAAERERLALEKDRAVAEASASAAERAMQRLAETLLATDVEQLAAVALPRTFAAAAPAAAKAAEAPVAEAAAAPPSAPAAASDDVPEDPWIDSVLCTTCNDCINLNNRLFTYNANKQAVIGDASAGTFAELVAAAEKCPSRCIHPGKPANAAEPGLADLVQRAARFN